ncbi:toprim domain-containing protein [Parabacteroides sp. D26]|uniref:toprim domain-containing protein n=1 Tax=Parabacteroides sp. D26 TaxID=658662 RepID=UPI003568E547
MNTNEAKQIRIEEYLHSLGYSPVRRQGGSLWYKSPFRNEQEPSFKVNTERNLWYDFGAGKGGNIIALAQELYASDSLPYLLERIAEQAPNVRPVSFSFGGQPLSKPSFRQLEAVPLSSPALYSYLRQRGINTELAKRECREVRYLTDGKPYFAVGFPNRSGGYEIRNKFFKGCIAPKDITHIRQEQPKEACYLFEGFMDYLSFLTLRLKRCPERPELDGQDYIVLNSTSNLSKAIQPLGGYGHIHCFLDNDRAGIEAVRELQKEYGLRIRDVSYIYGGYNDLNDFLCGKRSGQTERRQGKRQRQAEQPGKKGRGIRM